MSEVQGYNIYSPKTFDNTALAVIKLTRRGERDKNCALQTMIYYGFTNTYYLFIYIT